MRPTIRRSRRRREVIGWSAASVLVLVLAGCAGGSTGPAMSAAPAATGGSTGGAITGQTITLYNGQHEQTTTALVAAFEKLTGAKLTVRSDDEDVLAQQIEQEGANSPADAF
jgi:iron(III) transport system substrate-binding protein